jgi:phosphoglucosamine mutase
VKLAAETQAVEAELAGRGRVLIRASGTEPLLRIMVEADDALLARRSAERLAAALS